MKGLAILSDGELLKSYEQAVEIQLDELFIEILLKEINRRGIDTELKIGQNCTSAKVELPFPIEHTYQSNV